MPLCRQTPLWIFMEVMMSWLSLVWETVRDKTHEAHMHSSHLFWRERGMDGVEGKVEGGLKKERKRERGGRKCKLAAAFQLTTSRSSLDSCFTTKPSPLSSLNMLSRSSQVKPQTPCASTERQTQRDLVYIHKTSWQTILNVITLSDD